VVVVHADHSQAADVVAALAGCRSCGLAFIDGAHDAPAVRRDVRNALRLLHSSGVVCGHDWGWPGVEAVARELFGERVERGPGSLWFAPASAARSV
jgi:hypothetical protein